MANGSDILDEPLPPVYPVRPGRQLARLEERFRQRAASLQQEQQALAAQVAAGGGGGAAAWSSITGKPDTFPPDAHSHPPLPLTAVGGIEAFVLANDDLSTAAVTNRNLTGLVFPFLANATYIIDLYVYFSPAAATTGLGLAIDTSVAVTRQGVTFEHQLASAGTLTGGDAMADAAARGLSSGTPATGTTFAMGNGGLKAGANAGTAQLVWRPEVAAVATVQAGTVMRVQRVA